MSREYLTSHFLDRNRYSSANHLGRSRNAGETGLTFFDGAIARALERQELKPICLMTRMSNAQYCCHAGSSAPGFQAGRSGATAGRHLRTLSNRATRQRRNPMCSAWPTGSFFRCGSAGLAPKTSYAIPGRVAFGRLCKDGSRQELTGRLLQANNRRHTRPHRWHRLRQFQCAVSPLN